jgi:hypothetical protein
MLPPTTTWVVSKSTIKRTLVITSLLAEISTQTMVSAQSHTTNTHNFEREGKVVRSFFQKGRVYRLFFLGGLELLMILDFYCIMLY